MNRYAPLVGVAAAVALCLGCAGRGVAPAASAAPAAGSVPTDAVAADESPNLVVRPVRQGEHPPAPVIDTTIDLEFAEELRQAADSAADALVLDELAAAEDGTGEAADAATVAALAGATVSWDIDVSTYAGHDRVQYWLSFFQGKARERMSVWLTRMPKYEPMIREELKAKNLPTDLVYLALIESGFSNTATSYASAVGMWQFMRGTAGDYGLRVDSWVDERRDPYKATRAAARYLSDLYGQFGSLYLAAAAYNAGGGRVSRSLGRLPKDEDEPTVSDATFFRLYDTPLLHRETRDYVPKLIAAALIAKEPARYGFDVPADIEPLRYDSIVVKGMVGLDVVARLADTTVTAVRELNRQYLRLTTPPTGTWVVRLPHGKGESTRLAYAKLPVSQRISYHAHVVRRGETLSEIAQRYRVSQAAVRAANPKMRGTMVRIGQRLVIPTGGAGSAVVARSATEDEAPPRARREYHQVRRGESISVIAQRYEISQRQLRQWNGLGNSSKIQAGQRLRIAPARGTRVAGSGSSRAHAGAHAKGDGAPAGKASRARTHTVRAGDTVTGLAQRYGVTVQALKKANRLNGRAVIRTGQRLKIPG